MKLPSFKAVIWCWEERQAITAIAPCGTSTFTLFLPSDCKDNIYTCIQIISRIELVLELQILKLQWYCVDILNAWWPENAKALIKQLVFRRFAGPIFRKSLSESLQTLSVREFISSALSNEAPYHPTGHDRRGPPWCSMYLLTLFFLRSRECSGNVKSGSKNPSAFGTKLHVETPTEKIIIVHMLLQFNYSLSCKEPGSN